MQKINNFKNTLLTTLLILTVSIFFGQEKEIKPPNFSVGAFYSDDFHYNRSDAVQSDLGYKWGFTTSKFINEKLYISLSLGKQQLGFKSPLIDTLYFQGMNITQYNSGSFTYANCKNCTYEYEYNRTIIPVLAGYYFGKRKLKFNIELGSIIDCFLKTRLRVIFADDQYYENKSKNNLMFFRIASNVNLSYFILHNFCLSVGTGIRFIPLRPKDFTAYSAHITLNYIFRKK